MFTFIYENGKINMKMFYLPKKIIIWDTEFTCWENSDKNGWTAPGQAKELIQIGAIRLRTSDFSEIDKFDILIKPMASPVLSDYLIELTGITQKKVDKYGLSFKKALPMFLSWVGKSNLYSWGLTDFWALAETCKINGIILPIPKNRFFDARMIFWKNGVAAENYQSSTIVRAFGKKPERHAHSSMNDAQTIVDALRALRIE